jgi:hypothetical protein
VDRLVSDHELVPGMTASTPLPYVYDLLAGQRDGTITVDMTTRICLSESSSCPNGPWPPSGPAVPKGAGGKDPLSSAPIEPYPSALA